MKKPVAKCRWYMDGTRLIKAICVGVLLCTVIFAESCGDKTDNEYKEELSVDGDASGYENDESNIGKCNDN